MPLYTHFRLVHLKMRSTPRDFITHGFDCVLRAPARNKVDAQFELFHMMKSSSRIREDGEKTVFSSI